MYIAVSSVIGAWQILQKQDKNILYYYCAQRPYSLFIKKYTKNKQKFIWAFHNVLTDHVCKSQSLQYTPNSNPIIYELNVHRVGGVFVAETDVQENQICWHGNNTPSCL